MCDLQDVFFFIYWVGGGLFVVLGFVVICLILCERVNFRQDSMCIVFMYLIYFAYTSILGTPERAECPLQNAKQQWQWHQVPGMTFLAPLEGVIVDGTETGQADSQLWVRR